MDFANTFRRSYLNIHSIYLKSIRDVIAQQYHISGKASEGILEKIEIDQNYFGKIRSNWRGDEEKAFRNLRNSWYHECALRYPFEAYDKVCMKFAPWKTIQFYYAIYTSASAIVRCCNNQEELTHEKVLRIFGELIMRLKLGINFLSLLSESMWKMERLIHHSKILSTGNMV